MLERTLNGALHVASAVSAIAASVGGLYGDYAFAAYMIGVATYLYVAVRS